MIELKVAFTPKENGLLYVIHCLETMRKDGAVGYKNAEEPISK